MSKHDDQSDQHQPVQDRVSRISRIQVGDPAPNFTLLAETGVSVSLGDFLGKAMIVLYFYPRDNTSVCTAEACAFRDNYQFFKDAGAEVIGISVDSVESHQQFASAHHLPFHLLSDTENAVRRRYGVPTAFGLPGRVTYVIDRRGIVRHMCFSQFTSQCHVEEAMQMVQTIQEELE